MTWSYFELTSVVVSLLCIVSSQVLKIIWNWLHFLGNPFLHNKTSYLVDFGVVCFSIDSLGSCNHIYIFKSISVDIISALFYYQWLFVASTAV